MKKLKAVVSILLAAALCVGCSSGTSTPGAGAAEGGQAKDTIIVAQGADPKSLDPQGTTDLPASRVISQINQNLVEQDENMNIVPALAESWEIVDDTTYVFKIRQGVKFHNGEELTANDVLYTFQRAAESPHAQSILATIDVSQCKVVDPYTFEMKLSSPFGPILAHLAHNVLSIVNEKAVVDGGESYAQNPIGTGPYKFSQWVTGDRVELVKFDEYWGEAAKISNLIFRTIPEAASRTIELETGGIDVAVDVLPSDIARLEGNEDVVVARIPDFSTSFVVMTCTQGPLQDVKVRQAINHAIDTEAILQVVYQGTGVKGTGPMSPTIWGYNGGVPQYEFNPDKAKSLLAEAGYADGLKLTITTDESQTRIDTCEIVQNQLQQVGIELEIKILERGAYLEKVFDGALELFVLGWSAATGDPDYALYSQYHSSNHGESGNMAFYTNPEVDALLEIGRNSTDEAARKAAYEEAQVKIMEDAPCVYIQHGEVQAAFSKAIKTFNATPANTFDFSKFSY